jgi:phosphoglycolate phosphatase
MFRFAILDFDGTLASTLEGIHATMAGTLVFHGYGAPSLEEVRTTVGLTLEASLQRLAKAECSEERIAGMVLKYRSLHAANAAPLARPYEGAAQALTELRAHGIRTVVVSNKGRVALNQLMAQLGFDGLVDTVLSAEDVQYRKPDARLFREHIVPLLDGVPPEEVVVVGDTESDLLFARDAGLQACWATYGYGDPARCGDLQPLLSISAIADLPRILARQP